MSTTASPFSGRGSERLRLGVLLWCAGMPGVIAMTLVLIPQMLARIPVPLPPALLVAASAMQSAAYVALAVWAGVALGPAAGLHAPVFEAVAGRRPIRRELRRQIIAGIAAGVVAGLLLTVAGRFTPEALIRLQQHLEVPVVVAALYGGITEELLVRWGLMTLLAWLLLRWRAQRRHAIAIAVVLSAVLFGVGHLPTVVAFGGSLSGSVVGFIVGANASFGVLFGYLFARYGLEAAMIAHGSAHVVAHLLGG